MNVDATLKESGLEILDAEVLLSSLFGKDRSWLLGHGGEDVESTLLDTFQEYVSRRKAGEPVAYITGEKEFYERTFAVDTRVLVPRPSTEGLIDATLDFLEEGEEFIRAIDTEIVAASETFGDVSSVQTIVDIGTGSGCIAITLKLEIPDLSIIAIDVSSDALEVAKANAESHVAQIDFREGNLLDPVLDLKEPFIIVSNPPYVPLPVAGTRESQLQCDCIAFEPPYALFAGPEGLDIIRPLREQARKHPFCQGIILECRQEML